MVNVIRSLPQYKEVLALIGAKRRLPALSLGRAARLPFIASLYLDLNIPLILITDKADRVLTIQDELGFWEKGIGVHTYPEPNPLFYEPAAWGTVTRRDRIRALASMAVYHNPVVPRPGKPPLIVTTARALMTRTLPRRDFLISSTYVKKGETRKPGDLIQKLFDTGYQGISTVLEPGQYSRRGGIVDLWPAVEPLPVRIEFFGDEIDTLRRFDPASQRTVEPVDSVWITPAREYLLNKAGEIDIPLEEINEFHIPLIHKMPASFLDYVPRDAAILFDDIDLVRGVVEEIEEQALTFRKESIGEGIIEANFPIPYLSWSELQDSLGDRNILDLGYSDSDEPSDLAKTFAPTPRFGGHLKEFIGYLEGEHEKGNHCCVVSRQKSRLKELWDERAAEAAKGGGPEFIEGTLSEGWMLLEGDQPRYQLITDSEIFGWDRPHPRQKHRPIAEAPEAAYADLNPGDLVVHVDHGIGVYRGLVQRALEGVEREFLCVEYEGEAQLFVPIYQADRLTRYIGSGSQVPSLSRLGGIEWGQTKSRVREGVEEIARELLDLYAKRQVSEGFSFPNDTVWQQELEASFPYIETEDQVRAIQAVKTDMEAARPMDRLLCGDVGYGKTEVALRAAFKAIMGGKQVAILVPTTVLAQQHYETFRQRLLPFPVEVEMLSRFRSTREQSEILFKLADNKVDVIIGTHRLLQEDVIFHDLGLVIIDEEQRFGVAHKEYLKKFRNEVDVLTLTATPIPRTLYMALTGVRDISTINTPPDERLPIVTHIGPYSPKLVRQAIIRELERRGQIFFVHNRVHTIRGMYAHLNKLVPEARIGIAHGQLPEADLAKVMTQFTHGEIDILLCTSIIESGLDIPNANTLIVDRADTFGLAQLYQLRGRVGRGAQRAYAYFFRHRRRNPTIEGEERLEIIAENTQLGSGYSIAMRDLEMRGAGEMLGTRQHGYIASIGFHLYTRLLAQSVRQLQQAESLPLQQQDELFREGHMPVSVDLPLLIGIPKDYVPDQSLRLRLYRRLADMLTEREVDTLEGEFYDRFGPLPEDVKNLFYQMRVKIRAEAAGLVSVSIENNQIVLRYPALPEGAPARKLPNIHPAARSGKNSYWLVFDPGIPWQEILLEVLALCPKG